MEMTVETISRLGAPESVATSLVRYCNETQTAAGDNLVAMLLYGGLARGRYFPERSDVNVALFLRQTNADMIEDDTSFSDAIDQALRRLESGTFGECASCSEPISEARIKAFPFTTLCIDCKAELESEEQRYPGRA